MPPSLHISAGPSTSSLTPVAVNHDTRPVYISSPTFRGRVTVRIKSFTGHDPEDVKEHASDSVYFDADKRRGITWSVQVQGRFLSTNATAADLVFGNQFEKPIRDHLPYGTSLALQFVKVVDPSLRHELYGDEPWAFSPLVATMTHLHVKQLPGGALKDAKSAEADVKVEGYPAWPTPESDEGKKSEAGRDGWVVDDTSALFEEAHNKGKVAEEFTPLVDEATLHALAGHSGDASSSPDYTESTALSARKKVLGDAAKRSHIPITPQHVFTADFCNGFIDFNTLGLSVPFAGGLQFDLKKYWDGQPVTYVCKHQGTGDIAFVVRFNIQDLEAK